MVGYCRTHSQRHNELLFFTEILCQLSLTLYSQSHRTRLHQRSSLFCKFFLKSICIPLTKTRTTRGLLAKFVLDLPCFNREISLLLCKKGKFCNDLKLHPYKKMADDNVSIRHNLWTPCFVCKREVKFIHFAIKQGFHLGLAYAWSWRLTSPIRFLLDLTAFSSLTQLFFFCPYCHCFFYQRFL